jgi:hypothetical protein
MVLSLHFVNFITSEQLVHATNRLMLAYTQASNEFDMYMELPKGVEMKDGNWKMHVLKLLKNLYGQKHAGRVWNQHLVKGLRKIGFLQSEIDACMFYRDRTIFVVYVDDGIFASLDSRELDKANEDLRKAGFDVWDTSSLFLVQISICF